MSVSPYMGSLHIWAVFVECMGDVTMSQWEHSFVECIQVISIYGQYLLVMSVSPYMGSLNIWAVFVECIVSVSFYGVGDVWVSIYGHIWVCSICSMSQWVSESIHLVSSMGIWVISMGNSIMMIMKEYWEMTDVTMQQHHHHHHQWCRFIRKDTCNNSTGIT